jgi:hypothetical protein
VPAQDGVGGDDEVERAECGSGEAVEQGGEERAVGWGEAWFGDVALQDGQLVAQDQDWPAPRFLDSR